MLLGPSPPAALNRWKGWQSLLENDLEVCKALKTEKWNSCVCIQHTCPSPPPLSPPSRRQAGGFSRSYCNSFIWSVARSSFKNQGKNFLCWITWKTTKREEEKSFSSDSKLSHLWVLKYCSNALLLTTTWLEKKEQQSYILGTLWRSNRLKWIDLFSTPYIYLLNDSSVHG